MFSEERCKTTGVILYCILFKEKMAKLIDCLCFFLILCFAMQANASVIFNGGRIGSNAKLQNKYRNVNFDVRNYNKIQMFVHAESNNDLNPVYDDEATVFVRLGTDFISNYYEYEMPLKISPWNDHTSSSVWPEQNNMVINLNSLKLVKVNELLKQPD